MSKKQPKQAEPDAKRPLRLTPQIAVGLCRNADGEPEAFIERPNASATRHQIRLTPDNAYDVLMEVLLAREAAILAEAAQAEAERTRTRRRTAQPDWTLIARHPQAVIIERLATRSRELAADRADHSLEEMGL